MTMLARLCTLFGFIVLLVSGVYYHRPSERILGQADAASYLFSAMAFARGDGFGPRQQILDAMPSDIRECVVETKYPLGLRDAAPKLRPRPFYLEWQLGEENPGSLVPRFPLGYPAVLSLGYSLAGWGGVLAVNGVLMLLAGLLIMYLASKWAGPIAGLFAAGLWAVFPLNIWIANTTLAEPLVLVLGLAAVAAWVRSRERKNILWPILMGFCVGIAPIVKLDAIPWLVLPVVYAWENRREGIWQASLPALVAVPCLLAIGVILIGAQSGYLAENMVALFKQPVIWIGMGGTVVGLLASGLAAWRFRVFAKESIAQEQTRSARLVRFIPWSKWAVFMALAGVFGYFYFVRPHWVGTDQFYWAPMGRVVPSLREVTLIRLGWYLPPVALWVAMLSAGAAMLWEKETWMRTFAGVGVAILLFVSYDHINFPVEPFASRRLLPQAMPVLIVALAGANTLLRFKEKLWRWWAVTAGLIVLYASAHGIRVNAKMNSRADAEGLLARVRAIAETVEPGGIIVLRQSSPLIEVAPLLAFGFQRDVMPVRIRSMDDRRAIERFLRTQEQAGYSIWLWTHSVDDRMGFSGQLSGAATLQEITVPFLHMTTTEKPFSWDKRVWKYSLRKISFAEAVDKVPVTQNANKP